MIINETPLSMSEATEYLDKKIEEEKEVLDFAKKFESLKPQKAKELKDKLKELDLIKLNDIHISKIIDLLPQDKEDLNKIFVDVNLDEDETNKVLDTIKEFK